MIHRFVYIILLRLVNQGEVDKAFELSRRWYLQLKVPACLKQFPGLRISRWFLKQAYWASADIQCKIAEQPGFKLCPYCQWAQREAGDVHTYCEEEMEKSPESY